MFEVKLKSNTTRPLQSVLVRMFDDTEFGLGKEHLEVVPIGRHREVRGIAIASLDNRHTFEGAHSHSSVRA